MNQLNDNFEQMFLEETGKVIVKHTREILENLAQGPVTVGFFETMMDEICEHYSQDGEAYMTVVERLGEKLDEYLNTDRERVVNWLETENPSLGMAKPIELLFIGRGEGLIHFVENLIAAEKQKN